MTRVQTASTCVEPTIDKDLHHTEPNSVGQVRARDVREMPSVRCADQNYAGDEVIIHLLSFPGPFTRESDCVAGSGQSGCSCAKRDNVPSRGSSRVLPAGVEAGPLSDDQSAAWVPLMTTSPPDVTAAPQKTLPQKPNRNPAGFAHAENSISFVAVPRLVNGLRDC
ncbi:hypothetical protein Bbelb_435560 [Branchiostoma belcheri]|nr:hypothetical protein Bbelb_435560 [Branchiostoma belcheri]